MEAGMEFYRRNLRFYWAFIPIILLDLTVKLPVLTAYHSVSLFPVAAPPAARQGI